MNDKNHSTTINCPACYSTARVKLRDDHEFDYECTACGCMYAALTLADRRRMERAAQNRTVNVAEESMIIDNEAERAKMQKENESFYAGIMDKAKKSLSEKQLKALEDAENGEGNAYGVTKDPSSGVRKRAVQTHKRRGYHHGRRKK